MRNLTTIILGVASVVLAIVISAVEKGPRSSGGSSSQLVRFEEKDIQSITLSRGGQSVVMKQVLQIGKDAQGGEVIKGFWFFTQPEQERINSNSMAALLDLLNHLTVLDRFEKSELVKEMTPANLGLVGEEALQVVIETKVDGKTKTDKLIIGRATPRENSVYASLEKGRKSRGVVVVNGNPHDILDSPYETLMDRRLVGIPGQALIQVALKTSETGVVLQRGVSAEREIPWAIVRPINAKADSEKVDDLISAILALPIMEADSYDSSPMKIPNPVPEDAALIQFGVYGSEKPVTLYLEKDKSHTDDFGPPMLIARISDRPARYRLNSMILDSLDATAGKLRDRRLGKIPEQALESIAIVRETPKAEVFLKANRNSQGVNWVVLENGKEVDANYAKVNQLIDQMNQRVIIGFIEDGKLSDYGIQRDTALKIYFNFKIPGSVNEDGSQGKEEEFTRLLRLGWKKDGETRRLFANFNGETRIFELDPAFSSLLPTHPIKWRALNVLSFNSFRVTNISREVKGQGKIDLAFNNRLNSWKATRGDGTNVTNQLDRAMADGLRDRLSSLKALGWNLNVVAGYKLLETPDAVFTITTSELDRATNKSKKVVRVLKLVESNGIVYGRVDENPDLFFLDREKYKSIIKPLTSFSAP